jgi:hypothetical protein
MKRGFIDPSILKGSTMIKFSVSRSQVLAATQNAKRFTFKKGSKKGLIEVYCNGSVWVSGCDTEHATTSQVEYVERPVKYDDFGGSTHSANSAALIDHRFSVSSSTLEAVLKATKSSEVDFSFDGVLSVDGFKLSGATCDVLQVPTPKTPELASFEIRADYFAKILEALSPMTDDQSCRYVLNSILVEVVGDTLGAGVVHFVATDGRRLGHVRANVSGLDGRAASALITASTAKSLATSIKKSRGTCEIQIFEGVAVFTIDGATFSTRLTEGRFPKWRDVFGAVEPIASIPVEMAIPALKAAISTPEIVENVVTGRGGKTKTETDFYYSVDLQGRGDTFTITQRENVVFKFNTIATETKPERIDANYLLDTLQGLAKMGIHWANISFSTTGGPVEVSSPEGSFRSVIMTILVN